LLPIRCPRSNRAIHPARTSDIVTQAPTNRPARSLKASGNAIAIASAHTIRKIIRTRPPR